MSRYKVGDIVTVARRGQYLVEEREEDIKSGQPGGSGIPVARVGDEWVEDEKRYPIWWYDSQGINIKVRQHYIVKRKPKKRSSGSRRKPGSRRKRGGFISVYWPYMVIGGAVLWLVSLQRRHQ